MYRLLALLAGFSASSALLCAPAPAAPPKLAYGSLLRAVGAARASTWACQRELGLGLTRAEASVWALPRSVPYRRWALGLWRLRARGCALRRAELYRIREWPWGRLASCESGRRWAYDGSSGFDGGLQFHPSTWRQARELPAVRRYAARYEYAWQAPAWVQVRVAEAWLEITSWGQWPKCSRDLGLR